MVMFHYIQLYHLISCDNDVPARGRRTFTHRTFTHRIVAHRTVAHRTIAHRMREYLCRRLSAARPRQKYEPGFSVTGSACLPVGLCDAVLPKRAGVNQPILLDFFTDQIQLSYIWTLILHTFVILESVIAR